MTAEPRVIDAPAPADAVVGATKLASKASALGVMRAPVPTDVTPADAGGLLDDPVFREPWEAQAFAMTVLLHQRGLFTWPEWAQALSAQIAAVGPPDGGAAGAHGAAERVGSANAGTLGAAGAAGAHGAAERITSAGADAASTYYQHWLAALESLVANKGVSSAEELTRLQRAWEHAAHRTPHGQSIDLRSEDLGG